MTPEYCPTCGDIMEPDDVTGEVRCMTEHIPKGVPMPLITDAKDERLLFPLGYVPHEREFVYRDSLRAALAAKEKAERALCRAREALELVVSDFEMRDRHQSGRDEKRSNLCLAALASSSPCALRAAIAEHEPGELIAEITCPACGRELRVEHGDDEGEIGVLTK